MKTELKSIMCDYYETMAYALSYEWNDESRLLHEDILRLMLDANGASEHFELCLAAINDAACIKTTADAMLLKTTASSLSDFSAAVHGIKARLITRMKITSAGVFDYDIMLLDIENDAEAGIIHACKLLAYLKWLRGNTPNSRTVAVEIWKTLAMNGDEFSLRALVYAYGKLGRSEECEHWSRVLNLLESARDCFDPFIREDSDPAGNDKLLDPTEMDASLIMLIKRRNRQQNNSCLDRHMIHYALYSDDPFQTKAYNLSSGQDFFLLHLMDGKNPGMRIGF